MNFLENMRLGDIKLFRNWIDAPKGTLLQMTVPNFGLSAGMRTTFEGANGAALNALLLINPDHSGAVVTTEYLEGPALDIGAQTEIVAHQPRAFDPARFHPLPRGVLLRHLTLPGVYYVWCALAGGTASASVCVASDIATIPVGECYPKLEKQRLIGVAAGVDLRLRVPSPAVETFAV